MLELLVESYGWPLLPNDSLYDIYERAWHSINNPNLNAELYLFRYSAAKCLADSFDVFRWWRKQWLCIEPIDRHERVQFYDPY